MAERKGKSVQIGELIDVLEIAREKLGSDAEIEFSIEGQTLCREIELENISHGEISPRVTFHLHGKGRARTEVPEEARMNGKIVYVPEPRHLCQLPRLQPRNGEWRMGDQIIRHGTVWQCDYCSRTWKWTLSLFSHNWPAGEEPRIFRPAWLPEKEEERRTRYAEELTQKEISDSEQ